MKTSLATFILGGLLGLLAGLAIGRSASSPAPASPARPAPPAAAQPEPAPDVPPPSVQPAPAPRAASAPAPAPPASSAWTDRLQGSRRVSELLSLRVPEGEAGAHAALMRRARALLKEPDAQAALLAELPALSREQLVVLWDVFWMGDVPQRLSTFGTGFASELSRRLLDLYTTRTDPRDQELICNLLLPDLSSVSDDRLERLRSLLAADANPHLREKAARLPIRAPR